MNLQLRQCPFCNAEFVTGQIIIGNEHRCAQFETRINIARTRATNKEEKRTKALGYESFNRQLLSFAAANQAVAKTMNKLAPVKETHNG